MDITIADAFSDVHFLPPTVGVLIAIVIAVLLILVSGFASGSEIAFFSLSPSDLSELDPEKASCDRNIQKLRDDSERTLATILVTNTFANVTIVMLCNYIFASIAHFGPKAYWLQFVCLTVLLTFILLLFGEIISKQMYCNPQNQQLKLLYLKNFLNKLLY